MTTAVAVLDRLRVELDGADVVPTGAKARQVLALLALRAGRVVPVDTIREELWGDAPPATCRTIVQTYILQIRRAVARAGRDGHRVVERCGDGYRLDGSDVEIDADRFAALCDDAVSALRDGDPPGAAALAEEALRSWRGRPLADLALGPHLEVEVMRLESLRALAVETRFDAELGVGNHHRILGDLASEVARQPLNEHLGSAYAVALYRAGRQDQALETLRRLRAGLQRELGVEPSPATQGVLTRLLNADPTVTGTPYAALWSAGR